MNQQKQLDDWCAKKKSTESEQIEKETEKEAENLDVDNTQTIEVQRFQICQCISLCNCTELTCSLVACLLCRHAYPWGRWGKKIEN